MTLRAKMKEGKRGNALVLAVLILLTLSAVGLVSVQQTNTELQVAGNVVRSTQAQIAGEAGAVYGIALVGSRPQKYMDILRQIRQAGGWTDPCGDTYQYSDPRVRIGGYSTSDPDPTDNCTDQTDHLPIVDPASAATPLARRRQGAAYEVVAQWGNEMKGMPGYDLESDICHELFYFHARGGLPTQDSETVSQTLDSTDTVVVRSRANAIAGPVRCTLR